MQATIHGRGAPVIILHEWLGDHRNWEPTLAKCDREQNEFHCLDLPGYGKSRDVPVAPSAASVAEFVLTYADSNGFDRFSLVVHSMTGLVGHHLAAHAASRLESLIYFCPVPPSGFQASEADRAKMRMVAGDRDALREAILARGGRLESEDWVTQKLDIAWSASSPETKRAYLDMFLAPLATEPAKSQLQKAFVFCGEADLPFYAMPSLEAEFAPYYPDLEMVTLANCGHYPMLQDPEAVAALLQKYLAPASDAN